MIDWSGPLTLSWRYEYATDRCLECGHDTWLHEPDSICRLCRAKSLGQRFCGYRSGARA